MQNKSVCVGLLAHVDAGKTTLSEAILYKTGEIRKLGRVDHGDSYLDANELERNRGITVFSKQAHFTTESTRVTVLDTPGHVDFSAEMERVLSVIDYALLIVSASEGIQSHTETLWRLLRDREIPLIIFVNKMDLAVRDRRAILEELTERFSQGFVDCGESLRADTADDSFIDAVTLSSSALAEQYLTTGALTDADIAAAIRRREIYPCCFGSALKLEGIEDLLACIDRYTTENEEYSNDEFGARVFKVQRDNNDERLTFMRLTGGRLQTREVLAGVAADGTEWQEKVNQIRTYSGMKYSLEETVRGGDVVAVTGLTRTLPGDALGAAPATPRAELEPIVMHTISAPNTDTAALLRSLRQLEEEDPQLHVSWDSTTGQISIRLMGEMQLEVLQQLIADRFGYEVDFGPATVIYLETINEIVEGVGHFEPLRHYAEVHLILEPGERGSGLVFDSIVSEDVLARNWQRLILTHLEEKEHIGTLIGAPITDMKITLAAGRAHDKHTNGGDFREATYRALRQGLMQARANGSACVLEPYTEYRIEVKSAQVGRVMTDLEQISNISGITQDEERAVLEGTAPSAAIMDYMPQFTAATSGQGHATLRQAGYQTCRNQDELIASVGYQPERDTQNPADSVFVSHSESDIVPWDRAMERMHLQPVLRGSIAETTKEVVSQERKDAYRRAVATDAELRAIFERTYGATGHATRKWAREQHFHRDAASNNAGASFGTSSKDSNGAAYNAARNNEIRARHQRTGHASQQTNEPPIILIDGYNLINSDPDMAALASTDIGAARDLLLDRLVNYQGYTQNEVVVVFDAYRVVGSEGEEERRFGLRILYTAQDEPADIRLGLLARDYSRPTTNPGTAGSPRTNPGTAGSPRTNLGTAAGKRLLKIVSSDGLVQQNALVNNAVRVPTSDFLRELALVEDEISSILRDTND